MKLKPIAAVLVAFVGGTYLQYKFDRNQIKKLAPGIIRSATDKTWSEAFTSGYSSAVDDPTVRYRHYLEFKQLNEQE